LNRVIKVQLNPGFTPPINFPFCFLPI
jgi:hypothetical protein